MDIKLFWWGTVFLLLGIFFQLVAIMARAYGF